MMMLTGSASERAQVAHVEEVVCYYVCSSTVCPGFFSSASNPNRLSDELRFSQEPSYVPNCDTHFLGIPKRFSQGDVRL